ncbi:hypothetical protein CR513_26879, partial [Mucuna pruriens]
MLSVKKCNKLGHHVRICKSNVQQKNGVQLADQEEEGEQLFVAKCFASSNSSECWLVDSGCTSHMTHDQEVYKELDISQVSKVRINNANLIIVEGKGTVAIESCTGIKNQLTAPYTPWQNGVSERKNQT